MPKRQIIIENPPDDDIVQWITDGPYAESFTAISISSDGTVLAAVGGTKRSAKQKLRHMKLKLLDKPA